MSKILSELSWGVSSPKCSLISLTLALPGSPSWLSYARRKPVWDILIKMPAHAGDSQHPPLVGFPGTLASYLLHIQAVSLQ